MNNKKKGIGYILTAFICWFGVFVCFAYDKIYSANHIVIGVTFIVSGIVYLMFGIMEFKQKKQDKKDKDK